MENKGFYRIPEAILVFTKEEVALMVECSRLHYDGKCKDAGRVGGFLYGINNVIAFVDSERPGEDPRHHLTFRQVDTLAKIVEPFVLLHEKQVHLHGALLGVLRDLNAETQRINPECRKVTDIV